VYGTVHFRNPSGIPVGSPPLLGGFRFGVGNSGQDRTSSGDFSRTVGKLFPEPIVDGNKLGWNTGGVSGMRERSQ
jgi:hypothetical protein